MNCILLFHFILLIISITLLILGISTSRWLVYVNEDSTGIINEYSKGILINCHRFYRSRNVDQYLIMNNLTSSNNYINRNVYICFNHLYKWYNSSINGPELLNYHKVLIGISFGCIFIAIISLLLTQCINTERSFYNIHLSKRIVNYLLITNILTGILALITLILFFGFEYLQNIINYGYSFCNIEKRDDRNVVFKFANGSLQVTIRQGDLSEEICDVIVNPTRGSMQPNGGLDDTIHKKMGKLFVDQVQAVSQEMQDIACPVGQSRIFVAKNRDNSKVALFVINTVGPVYHKEEKEKAAFLLQSCYSTSFALANLYSLTSIAYPAISCGANHFPPQEAVQVGIESVRQYSCNVKDVRFVLYERPIYDAFVQGWTEYSQKINQAATTTTTTVDERTRFRITSQSTLNSIRICILCNEQQIPANREHLCITCSKLARSDIFDKFLQRLCIAAETSLHELEKACRLLKPILYYYPLIYTPVQKFDQSIHKRDFAAEYYLQNHCDKQFRDTMPMTIVGDGNCFYNTFLKLSGAGTTTEASSVTPVELRARNVVELVLRTNEYKIKYKSLEVLLDNFEQYVLKEMVHDTHFATIWDLLSIPTVLNIDVISIYPKVNGDDDMNYKLLNSIRFKPLISQETTNNKQLKLETIAVRDVKLLFSNCNKLTKFAPKKQDWMPNHFVPLLNLR
ncbi:unnamed protein product [Rotaria sordida]|uniref:Macro domain-containing protein n=1 Tax=Rotaria sordida TaxID=392033 RepID=A0A814S5H7_9BILA|nr:unnamed protein product [Rotaria sordida]